MLGAGGLRRVDGEEVRGRFPHSHHQLLQIEPLMLNERLGKETYVQNRGIQLQRCQDSQLGRIIFCLSMF